MPHEKDKGDGEHKHKLTPKISTDTNIADELLSFEHDSEHEHHRHKARRGELIEKKEKESHKESHEKGKDKEKKSDTILYVSIAIIVLSVFAILGIKYLYNPEPKIEKYTYNGFEFRKLGDIWYFKVQPRGENNLFNVPVHFGPRDVENVIVVGELDNEKFNRPEIFITFDPDQDVDLKYVALSSAELSLSMAQGLGAIPKSACTRNETIACADKPIKDCTSSDPVIYLKLADQPKVTLQGSCVLIEGKEYDLVRATDRLMLQWYGVMK